jgi:hypothetical protein
MVRKSDRLQLSAEPDGFAFYYGWAERDGERVAAACAPVAQRIYYIQLSRGKSPTARRGSFT